MKFSYARAPEEILRRSFAQVEAVSDLSRLPPDLHPIALRLVHACAMPEIIASLAWRGEVGAVGRELLKRNAPILADCRMVTAGISRKHVGDAPLSCFLDAEGADAHARAHGITRSAAGVELWRTRIGGALVVIGNAPTALFRLLELLEEGVPPPALLLAFPVGFVGAAESKQALAEQGGDMPFLTLLGRFGGSALAAAAANALAMPPLFLATR